MYRTFRVSWCIIQRSILYQLCLANARVVAKDYPTFLHQKLPVLFDLHTGRLALAMVPRDSLEIKLLREKMEQLLVDNDPVGHTNNRMIPIDNLVLIFSGAL